MFCGVCLFLRDVEAPSPTIDFKIFRGEEIACNLLAACHLPLGRPSFVRDMPSFSGAPRRSPAGCFVIFVNLFVFWTVEDAGPYNRFQNFIVGAIHESPVLTYDKCSFLRDVEDVIPYKKFYYSP